VSLFLFLGSISAADSRWRMAGEQRTSATFQAGFPDKLNQANAVSFAGEKLLGGLHT